MVILLVVLQVIAGVLLGALSFLRSLHRPTGGLCWKGWILFGISAALLIGSTASLQVLNARAAAEAQLRIEDSQRRIEDLMNVIARFVMTTPKGPSLPLPPSTGESIRILEPREGEAVEAAHMIRGRISDRAGRVWVVIHPLDTSSYWVQRRVSVGSGGDWEMMGFFGRLGSEDSGRSFEVLAVVDPVVPLGEGTILARWPPSRLVSQAVVVRRK